MKKAIVHLLFLIIPFLVFSQNQELEKDDKLKFGLGYSFDYNSKISHHLAYLFISKNDNLFFAGPEFNKVIKPFGDPVDLYIKRNNGVGIGYQRIIKSRNEIISGYAQLKFSMYRYLFTEYSLGSGPKESSSFILENTLSVGIRISPNPIFTLNLAAGFGSTQGFFLMFNQFIPTFQAGIQANL